MIEQLYNTLYVEEEERYSRDGELRWCLLFRGGGVCVFPVFLGNYETAGGSWRSSGGDF